MATSCSPHRDLAVNDAKMLAIALADTMPVVWGGSVLAARAARRVAESLRRATGTSAIAGAAENLLPVLEATRPRDVFDDPFADEGGERRPLLLVLDDGTEQELAREERDRLLQAASLRGIRTETVRCRRRPGHRGRPLRLAGAARPVRRGVPAAAGSSRTDRRPRRARPDRDLTDLADVGRSRTRGASGPDRRWHGPIWVLCGSWSNSCAQPCCPSPSHP